MFFKIHKVLFIKQLIDVVFHLFCSVFGYPFQHKMYNFDGRKDKLHREKDEMNDGALRVRFLASLGMTMFALRERGGA